MRKIQCKTVLLIVILMLILCISAAAISESDVEAQVASEGREAVAGNLFIWFLCAVAFLKISQKIDSFMSSLGINVGHTGGSMLAEAMLAARGISGGKNMFAGGFGGRGTHGGKGLGGSKGLDGAASFMSGGLMGGISRQFSRGAVKSATGQSGGGIGGKIFASSMAKGGDFANSIISSVAKGSISTAGSITGNSAAKALSSYMGYAVNTAEKGKPVGNMTGFGANTPTFSNVEIGGGRILGKETSLENPNGIEFAMYHADQFATPDGTFSSVQSVDGSKWYKQYAADTVQKNPYMGADGNIAYNEKLVKKLPRSPSRKERI